MIRPLSSSFVGDVFMEMFYVNVHFVKDDILYCVCTAMILAYYKIKPVGHDFWIKLFHAYFQHELGGRRTLTKLHN